VPDDEVAPDDVVWVDVPRHDVALTMEDLLAPLSQTSARMSAADAPHAVDPQVLPQLAQLSKLAAQLREVAAQVTVVQPELLAPGTPPGMPPVPPASVPS